MKRNQPTAQMRRFSSILRLGLGVAGAFASDGFAAVDTAKDTYYINDHLASTVSIADAAGEIAQIEADAFGTQPGGVAKDSRFTGKPYDADMGAYVFPFRNYRPEEACWMTPDPSGFPDGVNSNIYAPMPTSAFDATGAYSTVLLPGSYTTTSGNSGAISKNATVSTSKGSFTIAHYEIQSGLPSSRGGAELDISPGLTQTSGMLYFWQQTYTVTTAVPLSGVDVTNAPDGNPYYNTISSWGPIGSNFQIFFSDLPSRTYSAYLGSASSNNTWIQTDFTLQLVMVDASVVYPGHGDFFSADPHAVSLATIHWGYKLME